jgi:hypothetical protein
VLRSLEGVTLYAASKRIPLDAVTEKTREELVLKAANDWAQSHYKLAGQKYEAALRIKPRFELHPYAVFIV